MCGTIKTMCVELGTNLHDLGIQSGRFQFSPVPRRYLCQLRCPKSRRIRTRSRVFETNGFFSFEKLSLSQTYNLRQFRGCLFDSDSAFFSFCKGALLPFLSFSPRIAAGVALRQWRAYFRTALSSLAALLRCRLQ